VLIHLNKGNASDLCIFLMPLMTSAGRHHPLHEHIREKGPTQEEENNSVN
jgi:hypothetical protein